MQTQAIKRLRYAADGAAPLFASQAWGLTGLLVVYITY